MASTTGIGMNATTGGTSTTTKPAPVKCCFRADSLRSVRAKAVESQAVPIVRMRRERRRLPWKLKWPQSKVAWVPP
jgi:hypothetical protein